ncbi:MAG: RdgB/HAM1 family non-canonical purine NTP pyrophosphatase [Candidatus Magasanikbacteria bacterium]|nr:RdgB/HAM1 family non-canonical purine NTP pyrophosphatase [Candidatus Magasanikbacteria bacterium]
MVTKLLIATTNKNKIEEIKKEFENFEYFDFIFLDDLNFEIEDPEETEETLEGNSLLKAKYYAEKTGLNTLADDSGLFVNDLDGWPGVHSARVADSHKEKCDLVLEKLKGIDLSKRNASFRTVITFYDPNTKTSKSVLGKVNGLISEEYPAIIKTGFGYDPIFFVPKLNKIYDDLSLEEKNEISHRGQAIRKMKEYLQTQIC